MPFYYDPSPNPSPRSQAQAALYQALDSLNEARNDPSASAEELQDTRAAYEAARGWFRQEAAREAEAEAQAEP